MSTKYSGNCGAVNFVTTGTEVTGIKSWTLDVTQEVDETTSFDDDSVRAYLPTIIGWSGTFEGYKTGVPIEVRGGPDLIELMETDTATHKWEGNAIITGLTAATSHDGLATYAYTFQGTGALTEPTA